MSTVSQSSKGHFVHRYFLWEDFYRDLIRTCEIVCDVCFESTYKLWSDTNPRVKLRKNEEILPVHQGLLYQCNS